MAREKGPNRDRSGLSGWVQVVIALLTLLGLSGGGVIVIREIRSSPTVSTPTISTPTVPTQALTPPTTETPPNPQPARVYGAVPFSRFTDGLTSETVRLGGTLFRYVAREVYANQFKITGSTCRAVNLRVGFLRGDVPGTPAADLTVVSETAPAIHVTIPTGSLRTVSGRVGGDIAIYAANGQVGGFSDDTIFINGTLDCYTSDGTQGSSG